MPKRTPEEILESIEEATIDDEIERVLAMSPEEKQRELEAAGYDMAELDAQADALYARMQGGAAKQAPAADHDGEEAPRSASAWVTGAPPPPVKRAAVGRWTTLLAAALTLAVVGGLFYAKDVIDRRDARRNEATPDAGGTMTSARQIRAHALDACNRGSWQECLDGLGAARAMDPAGDADPQVQAAWEAARRGAAREAPRGPRTPDTKWP